MGSTAQQGISSHSVGIANVGDEMARGRSRETSRRSVRIAVSILVFLPLWVAAATAGPREQARQIHDRLVGAPPDETVLGTMADLIQEDGDGVAAAHFAMLDKLFYTTVVKNFATPWTNVEQSVFADLNDYTALVIGLIRDDEGFDQVLYGDIAYRGPAGLVGADYSPDSNEHYRLLERDRVDLSNPNVLQKVAQSSLPGSMLGPGDAAGIITTRAAGEAFFSAGTNRRMWRFVSMNFLCRDLEDTKDTTRSVHRIRQDVSRSPGGDSSIFLNHCSGCHSGMDPMAGAFAYFEWDAEAGRVVFTPGQVAAKYLINAETFGPGYATIDDRWDNYWRDGVNASLGWGPGPAGGYGPQSLGLEVAATRAFALCQVEKVFAQVCFRPPNTEADATEVESIADDFQVDFSMKDVFAETASYCTRAAGAAN